MGISYYTDRFGIQLRASSSSADRVTVDEVKNAVVGKTVIYELANPLTRSFSDLGITIPDSWDGGKPWIRVEAGGSFHLISGTPAKATVSFLTDLGGN